MKLAGPLLLFLIANLAAPVALSADAGSSTETTDVEVQADQETGAVVRAETGPQAEQADGQDPEEESPSRFIPTEQISQDLGVSFPADI